jgi:sterol desaturase/sphingolipid hydroxylase (fatty acid hydroxylase superfamily)
MGSLREQILLLITTPVYILVIGLEVILSHFKKQATYTFRDTVQNLYMMLANMSLDILFRGIYIGLILIFFYEHRFFTISNGWAYWIGLFILEDFMYYWLHRTDHYCRLFWAVHVTHHSSQKFNFTVGFRSSVMEPLYRFIFFIPLALFGFHPLDIAFIYSATQIWGILVHTEKVGKLGILEKILVTPSHHRVHHASNILYLDRNMGMFLIIWDKIFGTFQEELDPESYEPIRFGLTHPLEKETPGYLIFHEWQQIGRDIRRRDIGWNYIFNKPGWSHDGSRQTSRQLLESLRDEKPSHHAS